MTKKHKKMIVCSILLLLGIALYGVQHWVKHRLETELNQNNSPVHIGKITAELNPFHFTLRDVSLKQETPVLLGDFHVRFSLFPLTVRIQSFSDNPLTADIKLSQNEVRIQQMAGQILQMSFQATGTINIEQESGIIELKTKGLKNYVQKNLPDYFWLSTFLTDNIIITKIHPENGCLKAMNIPVWCYR